MARYGQQFKERVVARLLPPESSPVAEVSNKVEISVATLERWRAEFLATASDHQPRRWSPAARLEAVIATAGLDDTARSAWCREHGVFPTALDAWKRDAIGGLGEPGWQTSSLLSTSSNWTRSWIGWACGCTRSWNDPIRSTLQWPGRTCPIIDGTACGTGFTSCWTSYARLDHPAPVARPRYTR